MEIFVKRAYEEPSAADGYRVLVDRLWPRGVKKEALRLDLWAKELAPSTELRRWFAHDEKRWTEFRKRYRHELANPGTRRRMKEIVADAKGASAITLIYAAKDREHNEAIVLRDKFRRLI